MLAVTYSSLILTIKNKLVFLFNGNFSVAVDGLQLLIAVLLLVLGIMVAFSCMVKLLKKEIPAAEGQT
jgi:carbon starvation protein